MKCINYAGYLVNDGLASQKSNNILIAVDKIHISLTSTKIKMKNCFSAGLSHKYFTNQ